MLYCDVLYCDMLYCDMLFNNLFFIFLIYVFRLKKNEIKFKSNRIDKINIHDTINIKPFIFSRR